MRIYIYIHFIMTIVIYGIQLLNKIDLYVKTYMLTTYTSNTVYFIYNKDNVFKK